MLKRLAAGVYVSTEDDRFRASCDGKGGWSVGRSGSGYKMISGKRPEAEKVVKRLVDFDIVARPGALFKRNMEDRSTRYCHVLQRDDTRITVQIWEAGIDGVALGTPELHVDSLALNGWKFIAPGEAR